MAGLYSRIRVDLDQADLWIEILTAARNERIGRKIELRERDPDGEELEAVRWELNEINRMVEEVQRAKTDLRDG